MFNDIPQSIFRTDVMIAGIHIAVMFDNHGVAAGRSEYAQALGCSKPAFKRHVEDLHESAPDVVAHPFIENRAQEFSKLQRLYGPFGDLRRAVGIGRQQR